MTGLIIVGKVATGGANSGEDKEDDDALNLLDRGIYFEEGSV